MTLEPDNAGVVRLEGGAGDRLVDLLDVAGYALNTRCGGAGSCRGCLVRLGAGAWRVDGARWDIPAGEFRSALACRTETLGGAAEVAIPAASRMEREGQIVADFAADLRRLDPTVCVVPFALEAGKGAEALTGILAKTLDPAGAGLLSGTAAMGELPDARPLRGHAIAGRTGRGWRLIDVRAGDAPPPRYGVAVDIGTTTVVAALVNLADGGIVARAAMYNQQLARADDVAARISLCRSPEDVRMFRDLVVERTVNELLRRLAREAGAPDASIVRMAVAGNTVMAHLFLGLNPEGMGRMPFTPVALRHPPLPAGPLGLAMNPRGLVDILPAVAAYVGGDLVADLYVSALADRPEPALLVDIGTNGEILYAEGGEISACATAAGPAFEGAGLACGCRAAPGAIEHLTMNDWLEVSLQVIGGGPPTGLCGSAIVDFIAAARRAGVLNEVGRLDVEMLQVADRHHEAETPRGRSHAFRLADGPDAAHPVFVSEADLEQVMKAKAAIYAGMQTLLAARGRTFADVGRLILAGGFARHLDLDHAMAMGLLPRLPPERVEVIGNGALAGAYHALVDAHALPAMDVLARRPQVVELNLEPGFEDRFVEALMLP